MYFDHDTWLVLLTVGAAFLMMVAGLSKSALEWRHRQRICPSCGLPADRCRCRR